MELQTTECECNLSQLLLSCGMNIDAFFIWLFFPWNFKVNIINCSNVDLRSTLNNDHVISVLYEMLFLNSNEIPYDTIL